jgi:hypothetical protein
VVLLGEEHLPVLEVNIGTSPRSLEDQKLLHELSRDSEET